MSTSTITTSKLELRTAYGPVFRDVLNAPPRDCTPEEIPVIDLTPLFSPELTDRKALGLQLNEVCKNTGFFYIKDHGISQETIANAKKQLLAFFHQSAEEKAKIESTKSKYFNGWRAFKTSKANENEGLEIKESMAWRYDPQYDPDTKDLNQVPEDVKPWIRGEEFVWEGTSHLPNFKNEVLTYWASCLTLARKLVRAFALSLDLSENYFDKRVTYPGADGVFNYYPPKKVEETDSISLGSHTDLQLFTLLWQDMTGGLQVLLKDGQWINAPPIEGTFVVNIGDFMMRLCNDKYKSTVHRVSNTSKDERVSMPFFFGLNFNCVEGVVPSCMSEDEPPKYEPISCGDWCQLRFKIEEESANKAVGNPLAQSLRPLVA